MKKLKVIGIVFCLLMISGVFSSVKTTVSQGYSSHELNTTDLINYFEWWPMFGHDQMHTGFSSSSAPATNTTVAEYTLMNPGGSYSEVITGPNVVDGKLYLGSFQLGQIICADAFTGVVLWNRSMLYLCFTPPIVDGKVYVRGMDENMDVYLYCLDAETGDIFWDFLLDYGHDVPSSPVVSDGNVFFGTCFGSFYCLNATTGVENWRRTELSWFEQMDSSPAVVGGRVYAVASPYDSGPTRIYCFDAATGNDIWTYDFEGGPGKTPSVVDNKVYIGVGSTMLCLDAVGNGDGTTSLLWSYSSPGATSSAVAYQNVYFGSVGKILCVNQTTGVLEWEHSLVGNPTAPAVADGKVYTVTQYFVYCFDAVGFGNGTTEKIWQYALPTEGVKAQAQPAIAMDTLWVATYNNYIYAFCDNQPPERPARPTGPTQGFLGVEYLFTANTTDPNGDNISYQWNFNRNEPDETFSDWSDFVPSGTPVSITYTWNETGPHLIRVRARDSLFTTVWSSMLQIVITENDPPGIPATPAGLTSGVRGVSYTYTTNTTDPNGDSLYYLFDWGDGSDSGWVGPYGSGVTANASHAWNDTGSYLVKAKVKDAQFETNWSEPPLTVMITAPNLTIDSIKGGIGVTAVLKNTGDANATNVAWTIRITGGFFGYVNVTVPGDIPVLSPGSTKELPSGIFFGFGPITITVSATCDEGSFVEKNADGFIIVFYVILV